MTRKYHPILSLLLILHTGSGCKAQTRGGSDVAYSAENEAGYDDNLRRFMLADSRDIIDDINSFYYELFKTEYVRNITELEKYKLGVVNNERLPYSDGWWPEKFGGTNATGILDRYDAAFNTGPNKAAAWEKENHNADVSWYGHCNGFSAAAARHQNPQKSVYRPVGCSSGGTQCIEFQPHQIRTLLAEVYMNAKSRFLGGNRCGVPKDQLSNNPQDRIDPTKMDACDDMDPGSFHVALVNFIGIQKQTLVFDMARHEEVWNFPVYKYSYYIEENGRRLNRQEAIQATGRAGATDYVFNPAAVKFVKVKLTLSYAKALGTAVSGQPAPTQEQQIKYRYLLELDANENIVGGEWLSDSEANSRSDHPDFIWIPFEPFDPPGNRKFGNPYVSPQEVIKMWAESVGLDPNDPLSDPKNPNRIPTMPTGEISWGKHEPFFNASIDGTGTGAVFLGKRTHLSITRLAKLQGDVTLDLVLNGKPLISMNGTGNQGFNVQFDADIGMNELEFNWKLNGATPEGSKVAFRFYVMR